MGISHNIAESQAANTQPLFTPGPWHTYPRRTGIGTPNAYEVWDEDDNVPAGLRGDDALAVATANAHLIAAAPDMYEALKRIAESNPSMELFDIASAALAKARGMR